MDAAQGLAFLLFAFIAAVTPGPSNAMLLSTGAIAGAWRGLPSPLGASLGMGSMIVLSAFGVGEIVASAPVLVTAMKLAGSLFLLWLAWKILNAGPFAGNKGARTMGFANAFAFQWLNPKGWLVALSAGSTYVVPAQQGQVSVALWMGALFAAAALPAGLIWLGMGALVARFLSDPLAARIFNATMAALLAASILLVWR